MYAIILVSNNSFRQKLCHQHDYLQNILIHRREIERKFNLKYQIFPTNNFFSRFFTLSTQKRIKKDIFFESNFQTCVLKIPANSSIDPSCALNCALSALKTDTLHSFHVISSVKISFGTDRGSAIFSKGLRANYLKSETGGESHFSHFSTSLVGG